MEDKAVAPVKTLEEIRKSLASCKTAIDPDCVLRQADKELSNCSGEHQARPEDSTFKAMTLFEFDNGTLLSFSVEDCYKTFAVDLLRKFRTEYQCQTPSENARAEIVVLNFVLVLQTQQKINNVLSKGFISDSGIRLLEMFNKELERANKQFQTSLFALKSMRQPTLSLNLNAQTAVIGQNQVVQTGN